MRIYGLYQLIYFWLSKGTLPLRYKKKPGPPVRG
jgi:hypothetical protein